MVDPMRLRPFLVFLAAIAFVLLSTAAAGAVWISTNSPIARLQSAQVQLKQSQSGSEASLEDSQTDVAMFVSRQSPLILSVLANPDRLEAADLLSVSASQRSQRRAEWAKLRQSLLAETQFNYQRDIQPWLGDRALLAITTPDVDRDRSNGAQVGYLFAFTPKDTALAKRTMQRFWQRHTKARDRISETYEGVQITYKRAAKQAPLVSPLTSASALVGDRVVLIANSPKVLRDAINTVQVAEQSLTNSDAYQQAIAQLPDDALGFAFVNLPQFSTWLTDQPTANDSSRIYDSLLATLDATPTGLVAKTLLLPAPERPLSHPLPIAKPALSASSGALRFIPAASIAVATGRNLPQSWSQFQTELTGYENIAKWLQQPIAQLQQQLAVPLVSLPEAVLSGLVGDYAIALLPRPDRTQPDWLFVTQRSPETEAGLHKLDAIAREQGATVGSLPLDTPLGTQEIFAWTKLSTRSGKSAGQPLVSLDTQVQGVNTTVEDYEIFATSLEAIAQAIQAPEDSLLQSDRFKAAIASLKAPNDGYLYLADSVIRQVLSQTPLAARQLPLSSLLDQIRSLSLTSYGSKAIGRPGAVQIGR
jgi:Protein of unknown function (DUF3352)